MSCRNASRQLPPRRCFAGDRDSGSVPDSEHLLSCAACRSEWEIDRALGMQLRRALQARVAYAGPSAITWQLVRQRVLSPETDWDAPPEALANPEATPQDRPLLAGGWWTQPAPADHSGRPATSEWIVWSGRTPKFGL